MQPSYGNDVYTEVINNSLNFKSYFSSLIQSVTFAVVV